MKLDQNSDSLITGIRLRLDFSNTRSQSANLSLKLFNRVVKLKNYLTQGKPHPLWFDIPFCDAEVLYGSVSANNMQMELVTEDPKNSPIRLCAMEIFALSRKEFGYKEKVKKLEKLNSEKLSKIVSQ